LAAYAEDALDATHAWAFIVGGYDLFFLFIGVASAWIEDTSFATIFAPELLTAASIVTILDNV